MSKLVVCKYVRLAKDGDSFKKDLIASELRTNVKIDDQFVKEHNRSWKTTGHLYIVDEKATKARNDAIKEAEEAKNPKKPTASKADPKADAKPAGPDK
jgi:hypothetical protein